MRRTWGNWAIPAASFALLCGFVAVWRDRVPMSDSWDIGRLLALHDRGELGIGDFWAPFNGHRIIVPRLILFGLARATRWNLAYEVAASLVCALATFLLLGHLIRRSIAQPRLQRIAVAAVSVVVFSPLAWENWLWGWDIEWFLVNLGFVMALAALTGMPRLTHRVRFTLAVVGAVVATLSVANGTLVWLACAPVFFVRRDWRRFAVFWVACAIVTLGVFAFGYDQSNDAAAILDTPARFGGFAVNFILRPLSYEGRTPLVAAAVVVAAFIAVVRVAPRVPGQLSNESLPWVLLIGFGVLAAFLTAVGRARVLGATQANLSRYTTASGLIVVGIVILLMRTVERAPGRPLRAWAVGNVVAVMALVGVNYVDGVTEMERHYSEVMVPARQCAQSARTINDPCVKETEGLKPAWPYVEFVRQRDLAGL